LILTIELVLAILNDLMGTIGKWSSNIPLLANLASNLLLLQTIVLTLDLVTTWALWRFVHKGAKFPFVGIIKLGAYISRIPLLPSNHQEWQPSNIHKQYSNMILSAWTLDASTTQPKILHRSRAWVEWVSGSWMHVSLLKYS